MLSPMNSMESTAVLINGPAKTGKTTLVKAIQHSANALPAPRFNKVKTVTAGDMFRAAALYVCLQELDGPTKDEFIPDDITTVRDMLAQPGMHDLLQTDKNIEARVSKVAQIPGVLALCSTIFCDAVMEAYGLPSDGNLVIADARDPEGHLMRNDRLGQATNQVNPLSILPIYIDCPADIAAQRVSMTTDEVIQRRTLDATRPELPFSAPPNMMYNFSEWGQQFGRNSSGHEIASAYCFNNDASATLGSIQRFAGMIASTAQEVGLSLKQNTAA